MPFVCDDNREMGALIDGAFDLASEAGDDPNDRSHLDGWLVLADWLDDHDDPRAAYLRAAVEGRREDLRDWLGGHLAAWLGKLPRGVKVATGGDAPGFSLSLSPAAKPTPALIAAVAAGWLSVNRCNPSLHLPRFTSLRRLVLLASTNDATLAALRGSDVEILTLDNARAIAGYHALADCPRLRQLSIDRGNYLDDAGLAALAACPSLRDLALTNCPALTGARLGELAGLRSLQLRAVALQPEALRRSGPMPSLERLVVTGNRFLVGVLAALPALPALRSFRAVCPGATDAGLVCLERMPALERLDIAGGKSLSGAAVARLPSPERLRALKFTPRVGGAAALSAALRRCTGLHELKLSSYGSSFGEAALTFLSSLTELRRLEINNSQLTGEFLAALRGATHLEQLTIYRAALTDDPLRHLAALANLRRLALQGCTQFTGSGLRHLAALPHLESLALHGSSALANIDLGAHGELTTLRLGSCPALTDLRPLANLPSLRSLDLSRCPGITDAALRPLADLRSLQALFLSGIEALTDRGIAHLQGLTNLQKLVMPHKGLNKGLTDASLKVLADLRNLQELNLTYSGDYTIAGVARLSALRFLRQVTLGNCGFRPEDQDAVCALLPGVRVSIW